MSEPREPSLRVLVWAWDGGVEDAAAVVLPSLLQPNNLPWLARAGYHVALDFCTRQRDAERVRALAERAHAQLRELGTPATITGTLSVGPDERSVDELTAVFFKAAAQGLVAANAAGLFAPPGRFFGDGTIRNLVTYAAKPRVTVAGPRLPVERGGFLRALARARAAGYETLANAHLLDLVMRHPGGELRASLADEDVNATRSTGVALRWLDDDLCAYTTHAPLPLLFRVEPDDLEFFTRFLWNVRLFDRIWPSMLLAQNRYRVMTSSDLCCVAEIDDESDRAGVPLSAGMRFNDEYEREDLRGRIHQPAVMALRRETVPDEWPS